MWFVSLFVIVSNLALKQFHASPDERDHFKELNFTKHIHISSETYCNGSLYYNAIWNYSRFIIWGLITVSW
jgi:hypothetical protein